MNRHSRTMIARLALALVGFTACAFAVADADIKVTDVWAKPTVPGQKVAGAYCDIVSAAPAALVKAESPVAKVVELHTMKMEGEVMTMRAMPKIDLPAGKEVKLEPGGLHLMLVDIKQPLKVGEKIPLTLVIEVGGKTEKVEVTADVKEGKAGAHHH